MKFVCKFFLDFPIAAIQINLYWLVYEFAWFAGIHKSEDFDDVTTIENNRQVRMNIDAMLAAIFRIVFYRN